MAVYQISRIQIRRGRKNEGTGLPQLAGGEMAWAVDTQELFIGSGSVSDGAPSVENVKILTVNDNILDLAEQYQYKVNDSNIQTGLDANYPVRRSLQERLDDHITAASYGIVDDGTDQAESIQHAIDNLFLNPATQTDPSSRVTLEFAPGTYIISETIYVPSYASIVGAGMEKTIFEFTGTGSIFEFINDTSTVSQRNTVADIEYNYQPKFISMKDFSITSVDVAEALRMYAVRDSIFENIKITGTWESVDGNDLTSTGLGMYAFSSLVTCQRNKIVNISVENFCYGIYAKEDIFNNMIEDCKFTSLQYGLAFGVGANLSSSGQEYGPRKNIIKNNIFENIDREGIIIDNGNGNKSRSNIFINVGNDGGGNTNNIYSQIKFTNPGNTSLQDNFDRSAELASALWTEDYVAEIQGSVHYQDNETRVISVVQSNTPTEAFRLPINRVSGFCITYVFESQTYDQMRRGQLKIAIDYDNSSVQLVDEFEYTGTFGEEEKIMFSSAIVGDTLVVYYANENIGDDASLTYTYSSLS